jgi:hypothetical protein
MIGGPDGLLSGAQRKQITAEPTGHDETRNVSDGHPFWVFATL